MDATAKIRNDLLLRYFCLLHAFRSLFLQDGVKQIVEELLSLERVEHDFRPEVEQIVRQQLGLERRVCPNKYTGGMFAFLQV